MRPILRVRRRSIVRSNFYELRLTPSVVTDVLDIA